ncbi:MAG: periplasmic heavy metal sensor [Bacteroidales bacterium]|nr:periplasmic heavy metal sensor [Bacteroidales bacterium]
MNIFNNNRPVFWILIFLVLINITALATYYIYMRKPSNEPVPGSEMKRGIVLQQELELTPDQSIAVNQINATYQASSEPIVEAIMGKKSELLEELSKEDTDSAVLIQLTNDVVIEQKKLQLANIKQFLALKKVCTPEQTQKLSQIYAGLYGFEQTGKGKGQGKGNGKGYRHRYGQQKTDSNQPAK